MKMSSTKDRIKHIQQHIQREIGTSKAIIAVSGGIDSSVCAILADRAISKLLFPVYIRTGFNLEKEEKQLLRLFQMFGIKVHIIKREREYFNELKNIENSNKRRYMFGKLSLEFIKEYANRIGANILVNGVNKNDKLISNTVISYKQRVDDVKKILGLKLVEPIAELDKEEVKEIAKEIGLAYLVSKQHIPGPALAIRISGKITKEKLKLLKNINEYVDNKLKADDKADNYWQFFPFLLNERLDHKFVVVLRAVISKDCGLSADVKHEPDLLNKLASGILKEFPEVGRIMLDISPKPPITIEFM